MASDDSRKPDDGMDEEHGLFPTRPEYNVRSPQWRPPIDIYETSSHVVVIAELPGLSHDNIRICFNNKVLTISGEKKKVTESKSRSYFCVERYYGSFKRSFRIINEIDKQKMDATFDAGILTIVMPKISGNREVDGE